MILSTLLLLASYLAAAALAWGALLALVRPPAAGDAARLAAAALALGPVALAWVLAQLMRAAPGLEPVALAALVAGVIALPLLLLRRQLAAAALGLKRAGLERGGRRAAALIALLAAIGALAVAGLPLGENDSLEYAAAARIMYDARSVALYPFLDSHASGGFYGPWTHPVGYPALMLWSNIVQGGAAEPGLVRFPSWYSACATMLMLAAVAGGLGGAVAAVVLVSTPIYFLATTETYVDPVRIGATFATLIVAEQAARLGLDARRAAACGAGTGLAFFVHSIGVTLFPMVFALMLLYGPAPVRSRVAGIAVASVVAVAAVLPDLAANLRSFNAVVTDAGAVWSLPEVRYQEYLRLARRIATFEDQLVNGVFQGLSGVEYYGLGYWLWLLLALGAAALGLRRHGAPSRAALAAVHELPHGQRWMLISVIFVCMWGAMALAALLVGSVEFVKNIRYGLTVLPPLALFCGLAVAVSLRGASQGPGAGRRTRVGVAAALLATLACAGSLTLIAVHLARQIVQYPVGPGWFDLTSREMLAARRSPVVHVTTRVDALLKDGGCALLFRQADYAYYGKRCFRSYLDHRLIDLYRASGPDAIASILRQNDIRVILAPPYGLPEIFNTHLEPFLADPRHARLVWSWDGTRLYRVGDAPPRAERVRVGQLGEDFHLRDARGRRRTTIRATSYDEPRAELSTGDGSLKLPPVTATGWAQSYTCPNPVLEPELRQLTATIKGKGYVALHVLDYGAWSREQERSLSPVPVWEGVINGARRIATQYLVEPGQCATQRLRVVLLSPGEVTIEALEIARFTGAAPETEAYAANLAEAAGWSTFAGRHYSKAWEWGWSGQRGAMEQRIPARFALPRVSLSTPPVFLGPGAPPRSLAVEADMAGNARTEVFIEPLSHLGAQTICRSLSDPLYRVALLLYSIRSAGREERSMLQAGGAAATCYRPMDRIVAQPTAGAAGAVPRSRYEAANDGYEAVRVVFVQHRAPPESGAGSELALRRVRVMAVEADGSQRTLYEFDPQPGAPVIR